MFSPSHGCSLYCLGNVEFYSWFYGEKHISLSFHLGLFYDILKMFWLLSRKYFHSMVTDHVTFSSFLGLDEVG
jgi:hypothetical protein